MTLNEFVADLDARGQKPKQTATGYVCRCPAHEDGNPSLSISEGTDGRILLHCHAGCTPEAITSALGLQMTDLFVEPRPQTNGYHAPAPVIHKRLAKTYDYTDETGTLLFQTCRYEPKDFKQRRPVEGGAWSWSLGDIRKPIYRLPEVLSAVSGGQPIFVVEGEKDADAIVAAGGSATCNPLGAGKWRPEHTQSLNGASRIIIVADKDATGRKHAAAVAESCREVCLDVVVIEVPGESKDAADYLAQGGTVEELLATPESKPDPRIQKLQPILESLAKAAQEPDSLDVAISEATMALSSLKKPTRGWPAPISGFEWIKPENKPPVRQEIIHGLLRRGDKLVLGGGSKSCKTWFAASLAIAISAGKPFLGFQTIKTPALFINLELPDDVMWDRMARLFVENKVNPADCDIHFWNLRGLRNLSIEELDSQITALGIKAGFVTLDPLYKLLGERSENDSSEMASLFQIIEGIAHRLNAAVLIPAHFSKGNQSDKSAIDRIAGSGAIGRDADALVTMTAHEEEDAFTLDFTLRSYAPQPPLVVCWEYPLFTRNDSLDPANLKQAKAGRPKFNADQLLELFPDHGITIAELKEAAHTRFQVGRSSCYTHFKKLQSDGKIVVKPGSNPTKYVLKERYDLD